MRLRLTAGLRSLRNQVDHNDDIVSTVSNKLQLKQTPVAVRAVHSNYHSLHNDALYSNADQTQGFE